MCFHLFCRLQFLSSVAYNFLKKYILLIMLLQLSHFFLPFIPLCPVPPTIIPPPQFTSMGPTYKFFGFSISYTILNPHPLFCTYNLCFFFPVHSLCYLPSPCTGNPPCDLHFCDSVPVLVCLVCFCFLGSVVDSCEFVVISLFLVLIFFFLDNSL